MSIYRREIETQCCNQWMNGIRTINGQYPDDNRDFDINAGSGITIQPATGGITIINSAQAQSFVAGDNIEITPSGGDLEISLKDDIVRTGSTALTGDVAITGDLQVNGDIVQQGSSWETHAEKVFTTNDYITMRDGAVAALAPGDYSGFQVKKYDGTNDGRLVIDRDGVARVGDVGDEQPLMTRDESADLTNGNLIEWDATNNKAVDAGTDVATINTAINGKVSGTGNIGSDTKPIKIVNGTAVAVTNDLVDSGSNQSVHGIKTFPAGVIKLQQTNINVRQRPSTYLYSELQFTDINNEVYMAIRATYDSQGSRRIEANIRDINGNDNWTVLASRTD